MKLTELASTAADKVIVASFVYSADFVILSIFNKLKFMSYDKISYEILNLFIYIIMELVLKLVVRMY